MRHNFRFTFALAVAIIGLTGGKASAQVVSFQSMNYVPLPPPFFGGMVAPSGKFNPPNGAQWAGPWKVTVDYGVFSNGNFTPYAANTQGIPNPSDSAIANVGANGGGIWNWSVAQQFALFGANAQCRARLMQQVLDPNLGMMVWTLRATSYHTAP